MQNLRNAVFAGLTLLVSSASAHAFTVGLETDVIPWLTGGYHASVWAGQDGWKFRVVKALFHTPDLLIADGFTRERNDAFEIHLDRFFGGQLNDFTGGWAGIGFERYYQTVQDASLKHSGSYQSNFFAPRAGYDFKLGDHFYLNPWVGANFRIGGNEQAEVGPLVYKPKAVTPLASLKLGVQF
jgi:hypothetical protein